MQQNPIFHSLFDLEQYLLLAPKRFKSLFSHSSHSPVRPSASPSTEPDPFYLDIDLSEALEPSSKSNEVLFLNHYTYDDLVAALKEHGILSSLASVGYTSTSLIIDTSDSYQHRVSLVDASLFDPSLNLPSSERYLIDWFLRRRKNWTTANILSYQLMHRLLTSGSWEALTKAGEFRTAYLSLDAAKEVKEFLERQVEKDGRNSKSGNGTWEVVESLWMVMQNPKAKPKEGRGLLPSQRFPGLGLGEKVNKMMTALANDGEKSDAILNFPLGWHNAFMYARAGYLFLNPVFDAYFEWTCQQLKPHIQTHGFVFIAWAWTNGHIRRVHSSPSGETSRELERWNPEEQLLPCGESMRHFFKSEGWKSLRKKYLQVFEKDESTSLTVEVESATELWKLSLDGETRCRKFEE
ncbi:hypothetical protein BT69DRAFT_592653 [Atractiella rhizophila]|nr:hypothetical protein BT69DRAFT_592653 [Atractiella rhizophila]